MGHVLSLFFGMTVIHGCSYNQALADIWSTGAEIQGLYCRLPVKCPCCPPNYACNYKQALADIRSTGAGIRCLYCRLLVLCPCCPPNYACNYDLYKSASLQVPRGMRESDLCCFSQLNHLSAAARVS